MVEDHRNEVDLLDELINLKKTVQEVKDTNSCYRQIDNQFQAINAQLAPEKNHFDTLFSLLPIGVSVCSDFSCKEIRHNPAGARFLRINDWETASHSSEAPPPFKMCADGKVIIPEEMPIQRSLWFGEHISGQEIELIWEDGVRKTALFNSCPLVDSQSNIIGAIAVFEDITHYKQASDALLGSHEKLEALVEEGTLRLKEAQEKLKQNEELFRLVLLNSPTVVSSQDANLRYTWIYNPYPGFSVEEIVDRSDEEIFLPQDYQILSKLKHQVLQSGVGARGECTISLKGKSFSYDIFVHPAYDSSDNIAGINCVATDITERKQMEMEMARLDRLNIVGEMAASIGHEIRNPLTTIRGFLQMLHNMESYKKDNIYFVLMIEELDRANAIISEYLSMARNKKIDLQPRCLDEIIKSLHPMLQADAYYREMEVELELGLSSLLTIDENEIRQLILNIARNGLEAMAPGGKLTIGTTASNEEIVLFIRDQGPGLNPAIAEKLGTPFLTTKEKGTGLGMAVCYSIAARHDAVIKFDTGPDGTIFWIHFPLLPEQMALF
ncbi:MAG: ATP-binding protein [Syntrophomonas sp.]